VKSSLSKFFASIKSFFGPAQFEQPRQRAQSATQDIHIVTLPPVCDEASKRAAAKDALRLAYYSGVRGKAFSELAVALGLSQAHAHRVVKDKPKAEAVALPIEAPADKPKRRKHRVRRLSEKTINAVIADSLLGWTAQEVASKHGLAPSTVYRIRNSRTAQVATAPGPRLFYAVN
jgi:predicted DNA-binding transcriptional regulator AlpA